ncbi:hypothetical protein HYX58_06080 [Candidatus Dependentiae bacterium]|nr:hypothetical protein [Candidatus Dependentiae bacterium]
MRPHYLMICCLLSIFAFQLSFAQLYDEDIERLMLTNVSKYIVLGHVLFRKVEGFGPTFSTLQALSDPRLYFLVPEFIVFHKRRDQSWVVEDTPAHLALPLSKKQLNYRMANPLPIIGLRSVLGESITREKSGLDWFFTKNKITRKIDKALRIQKKMESKFEVHEQRWLNRENVTRCVERFKSMSEETKCTHPDLLKSASLKGSGRFKFSSQSSRTIKRNGKCSRKNSRNFTLKKGDFERYMLSQKQEKSN